MTRLMTGPTVLVRETFSLRLDKLFLFCFSVSVCGSQGVYYFLTNPRVCHFLLFVYDFLFLFRVYRVCFISDYLSKPLCGSISLNFQYDDSSFIMVFQKPVWSSKKT